MRKNLSKKFLDDLTYEVVGAAIEVHKIMGRGLLESVYHQCMKNEMHPVFEAQLLTYMSLLKAPKGILINFNCSNIFAEGQKTYVNDYFKKLL